MNVKEIKLKNGETAVLREPTKEDAKKMIEYLNIIGGESDFVTFGKNEFTLSIEAEEDYIEKNNNTENCKIILTIINDEIVGIASISSIQKERMKHNGTLGISVRKKYWGMGLGNEAMSYLIEWAKCNGITKKISIQKERMKHNGTLGISVRKKYWGMGLGNEAMSYLIEWAKCNGITKKISLLVREDNDRAIKLYENFGFEKEGLLKKDICVRGIYYNTIAMGLYID